VHKTSLRPGVARVHKKTSLSPGVASIMVVDAGMDVVAKEAASPITLQTRFHLPLLLEPEPGRAGRVVDMDITRAFVQAIPTIAGTVARKVIVAPIVPTQLWEQLWVAPPEPTSDSCRRPGPV
jgi:hypothetical protein